MKNFFSKNYKQCNTDDTESPKEFNNKTLDTASLHIELTADFNIDCTTKDYIDFLNGKIKTENSKSFYDIMDYTDDYLESDHRYIQWIFPTTAPSQCATNVPVIKISELQSYISNDPTIQNKLYQSYNMMIKYWGLDGIQFPDKIEKLNGHNALRLSRMLQSLVYHGRKDLAILTYELVSQHIGNNYSILNPLMYCGTTLENMEPIGNLRDISKFDLNKFGKSPQLIDVWKYHLLKASEEFNSYVANNCV